MFFIVVGTGTGIGKTLFAVALTKELGKLGPTLGIKPIESGGTADGDLLGQASTFHVTRFTPPYLLTAPVSPHLAARMEGREIDVDVIERAVRSITAPSVVLETAGGLFSPLSANQTNADLVARFPEARVILVAQNRLGVLHDVIATTRAARASSVRISAIVLSTLSEDAATSSNPSELAVVLPSIPLLGVIPPSGSTTPLFTTSAFQSFFR